MRAVAALLEADAAGTMANAQADVPRMTVSTTTGAGTRARMTETPPSEAALAAAPGASGCGDGKAEVAATTGGWAKAAGEAGAVASTAVARTATREAQSRKRRAQWFSATPTLQLGGQR